MGFQRKRKGYEDADDDVTTKRSKVGSGPVQQTDDDGNAYWEISGKRRLQISEYKGMTMVNLREYYEKDGKALPGKAGINLPMDQFKTFVAALPQVFQVLEEQGVELERPNFGVRTVKAALDDDDDDEDEDEEEEEEVVKPKKTKKPKKSNIEATSDEDEEEDDDD